MSQTKAQLIDNLVQPITGAAGSASAPTFSFTADPNTGIYSPGADQLAISSSGVGRLFVDSSGNIGVATSSPGAKFDVNGDIRANGDIVVNSSTTAYTLGTVSDTSLELGTSASATPRMIFKVGATERARFDSSGRLGLGTSSPNSAFSLDVATGAVRSNGNGFYVSENYSAASNVYRIYDNSSEFAIESQIFGNTTSTSAPIVFRTSSSDGRQERMRITAAGNVGVGTTSPAKRLHVVGDSNDSITSGASAIRAYSADSTAYLSLQYDGIDATITSNPTAAKIALGVNGSERARIDSSGRLLVGTSSWSGAARFITQGNATGGNYASMVIAYNAAASTVSAGTTLGELDFTDNAGGVFGRIRCEGDAAGGTNDYPGRLVFSTTADGASSPTERMRISNKGLVEVRSEGNAFYATTNQAAGTSTATIFAGHSATGMGQFTVSFKVFSNGNVQNTNNSYGAISDIKLKENIVDANSQWSDIKALQVRNYNFKEGQTHTQIGLVAQEVELVSPGLVSESPDRDEDGNDLGTVTKSVNYSVLYMKAVKALQEAMERIETLEASNTDLLARVSALESA